MMNVDEMITLANNVSYGLLLKASLNEDNYFLAVQLDSNEEPTDKYEVLKEVNDQGDISVLIERDPLILNELLKQYQEQADL